MKENKSVMYWEDILNILLFIIFIAMCFFGSSGLIFQFITAYGLNYGTVCLSLMTSVIFCGLLGVTLFMGYVYE